MTITCSFPFLSFLFLCRPFKTHYVQVSTFRPFLGFNTGLCRIFAPCPSFRQSFSLTFEKDPQPLLLKLPFPLAVEGLRRGSSVGGCPSSALPSHPLTLMDIVLGSSNPVTCYKSLAGVSDYGQSLHPRSTFPFSTILTYFTIRSCGGSFAPRDFSVAISTQHRFFSTPSSTLYNSCHLAPVDERPMVIGEVSPSVLLFVFNVLRAVPLFVVEKAMPRLLGLI